MRRLLSPLLLLAALLPARGQPAAGPVISLPPLLVETKGGPKWRYGELPGLRVLSCCDDDTSRDFVERNFRQQDLLNQLAAPDLQMQTSAPLVLILYDKKYEAALSQEVVAEMNRVARSSPAAAPAADVGVVPHLRLPDADSSEIYLILEEEIPFASPRGGHILETNGFSNLEFSPEYVAVLLDGRTPQLPPWFRAGLLRVYQDMHFSSDEIELAPFEWLAAADRDFVANTLAFGSDLLPPAELFSPAVLPDAADPLPVRERAWAAEAALFVRWAFDGRDHSRREALWHFAREASAAPATEEMFRRCFGFGYAQLCDELERYLPESRRELRWDLPPEPKRPRLILHDAAPSQIREIKGDWGRRVLELIRREHPDLLPGYTAQARQTLLTASAQGGRSPELLAALGQFYFQTGDRFEARAYLESAVQAGVGHPLPYVELAQLRLISALGQNGGRLGPAELGSIFAPVTAARRLEPALIAEYLLLAATWQHSAAPPSVADLAPLNEGARLFHRIRPLVLAAATLDLDAGDRAEAEALVTLALGSAPDAEFRRALLEFQATRLASPPPGRH